METESEEQAVAKIREALKKIKYGAVEIIIHDAQIVQIECREKIRLDKTQ
ncbi:MAG TPA: YezD family protein [Verrucomicrobiae bacterium]|jgi:hypothetical protein|nr:YezD family protein [Verrucomicrobiae bacterium]